jgi:hypothetical protein
MDAHIEELQQFFLYESVAVFVVGVQDVYK